MGDLFALDIETAAKHQSMSEYAALEPWRCRQGLAEITSVSIAGTNGFFQQIVNTDYTQFKSDLKDLLEKVKNQIVFAHYATFDVSWMIATLQPEKTGSIPDVIRNIRWRDSMLLAKWIINGQKAEAMGFEYNLKNLVKSFVKTDNPLTISVAEFIALKDENVKPGDNPEYWIKRGKADTIYTLDLVKALYDKLPEQQRVGFVTECSNIVPVANSWLIGIRIDQEKLGELQPKIAVTKKRLAQRIGINPAVVSSPKQLSNLLFNAWGLPVHSRTATNAPSTAKDALMWIEYRLRLSGNIEYADKVKDILALKMFSTIESKYVKTMYAALKHTRDGYIYGAPKIFGTYTGRFTYSNATKKVYKTGIALHQIPRKAKYIRELLLPPEGYSVIELDASGQESRLMALRSRDRNMIQIFANNLNFHAMTGAAIIGMPYDDFMGRLATEEQFTEYRQRGKLLNLAANYRIGAKSFSEQAFVKYEEFIDIETAMFMLNVFKKQYGGIPIYWDEVIKLAKETGYTEEFGGRRYKLSDWSGGSSWVTESAALMFPIQGSGASMKNIAIREIDKSFSDVNFILDLHDANFSIAPIDVAEKRFNEMNSVLNAIDYSKYWRSQVDIPLPYEGGFGQNFGDVK